MSRSSYSVNKGSSSPTILINPDPLLILEKSLEVNGAQWVENVNLIEEFLVKIVNKLGIEYPQLKGTFIVRRLANFTVPFTNKNEYAVILDKFDFSLVPHDPVARPPTDKAGKPNFGQIEIFLPKTRNFGAPPPLESRVHPNIDDKEEEKDKPKTKPIETMEDCNVFLNSSKAYYSHQVFKAFATAFTKVFRGLNDSSKEKEGAEKNGEDNSSSEHLHSETEQVQLIGPHLLKQLKCNPEVGKIFRMSQPHLKLSSSLKLKVRTTVNHLQSYISMSYEDTELIIRPALFYEHGYHRVNANLTERIPLYHSAMLTIGESLLKGCLLFPTSFETLWNLQFWPAESHILSRYHPSSVIIRLLKIHGAFCTNPVHFYETLNNNFLIGMPDLDGLMPEDRSKLLPVDYFVSSFLYELEEFSAIEDWAPRNIWTRLIHLFRTGIDAFDKGFHTHYFTKINVLRGLWRNSVDYTDPKEKYTLMELDDIRESSDDVEDYKDIKFLETNDLEDEFGLKFDQLDIDDEEDHFNHRATLPPRLTSDLVYNSVNPFQVGEPSPVQTGSTRGTKSLSKLLGGNLLRKIGGRSAQSTLRKGQGQDTVRSIADVASEFEKSVAQQRSRPPLYPFPISEFNQGQDEPDFGTSISKQNLFSETSFAQSQEIAGTSRSHYDNDAFEGSTLGGAESIYWSILQCVKELPPADSQTDPEVQEYMTKMKRSMSSQEELITSWGKVMSEFPKPKFICPHAFTTRQIQYLSRVIHVVSRCSPSTIKIVRSTKLPSWEISGDILRIVLHQMRAESLHGEGMKPGGGEPKNPPKKSVSFTSRSLLPKRPHIFKSFKRDSGSDPCKLHEHEHHSNSEHELDPQEEMQLAMEEPETAATNRLLQWLWQLRTSEIGRLSIKANKYLEQLYTTSIANSHFLEQHSEEKAFETLALRSAVAVTKIMETGKFPAHIPLSAASKKGWLWAEMVLSLASWNEDKGFDMKAHVPVQDNDMPLQFITKAINGSMDIYGKKKGGEPEPDIDALTLAFHSELATPIGWNDIEDPRQPGPFTVPILIFSSLGYYRLWEVSPGNLVHALVRLQKFNVCQLPYSHTLQHVGNMLTSPHRKTALNEVRKLNKTTSFRIHQFENNVMSKTFKRLASMRNSRKKTSKSSESLPVCLTCEQLGCSGTRPHSTISAPSLGREIECTKL